MRRLRETQAAVPKRRETPRDRPGRAGLRLCSKWLGFHPAERLGMCNVYAAQCQSSTRGAGLRCNPPALFGYSDFGGQFTAWRWVGRIRLQVLHASPVQRGGFFLPRASGCGDRPNRTARVQGGDRAWTYYQLVRHPTWMARHPWDGETYRQAGDPHVRTPDCGVVVRGWTLRS